MGGKRKVYTNPFLNEMVYSILRSASKEELFSLRGRFLLASKSEKTAKRFVATSRLEEKIALLTEFGIRFFLIFADEERVTSDDIQTIVKKYKEDKYASALQDISELRMHVTSDKEYAHMLGLMANTTNHPSYLLNLELNRAAYIAKKWGASTKNIHDKTQKETSESSTYLAKLILEGHLSMKKVGKLYSMTQEDLSLLVFFHINRHIHISRDDLVVRLAGSYSHHQVFKSSTALENSHFIEPHAYADPKKFTITSLGIKVVNSFMDKVFKNIEF